MFIKNNKENNYKFYKHYIDNVTGEKETVTTTSSNNDLLSRKNAQKILLSKIIQKKNVRIP